MADLIDFQDKSKFLDSTDVGALVGRSANAIRVLLYNARNNRDNGIVRDFDIPEPLTILRATFWRVEDIDKWVPHYMRGRRPHPASNETNTESELSLTG